MSISNRLWGGVFFLCFHTLVFTHAAAFGLPTNNSTYEYEQLGPMRQMGLQADRAHIPDLIAVLKDRPLHGRFLMETALHSLAQLGATDALPAINALIQGGKDPNGTELVEPNVVHAAVVARARLLAEAVGPDTGGEAQAQAQVARFYEELGETPSELNAALPRYIQEAALRSGPDIAPRYPVELYAVRELADMAYHSSYQGFTKLPGVAQVNFALDSRSALKVGLAPLPAADRAAWLVQDMSQKKGITDTEEAEIQLAGDLKAVTVAAATAQLQSMSGHTEEYPSAAFNALFGVMALASGGKAPIVKSFEKDKNPVIAYYARQGGASQLVPGY